MIDEMSIIVIIIVFLSMRYTSLILLLLINHYVPPKKRIVNTCVEGEVCGKKLSRAGIPEGLVVSVKKKSEIAATVEYVKKIAKSIHPIFLRL